MWFPRKVLYYQGMTPDLVTHLKNKQYPSQEAFGFFGSFSAIRSVLQYDSMDRYTTSFSSRVQREGAEAGRLEGRTGVL